MPGLDTNILVGWIVDDDPRQVPLVQRLFEEVHEQESPLFVASTVMLELEWALHSRAAVPKLDTDHENECTELGQSDLPFLHP
jgi:predicted nucleic-acid-binding protein